MVDRLERRGQLIEFVREDLERYRSGEIDSLIHVDHLKNQFGIRDVRGALTRLGLQQERKQAIVERKTRNLIPSEDLAWMIGILGGGSVYYGKYKGSIYIHNSNPHILAAFRSSGERLFEVNASTRSYQRDGAKDRVQVDFANSYAANFLGSFNNPQWPRTIEQRHSWIFQDPSYLWKLIEGIFDRRGAVYTQDRNHKLVFSTYYENVALFITDVLARAGVDKARVWNTKAGKEGVGGVVVTNYSDIQLIASHIHAKIPEKEEILGWYRALSPKVIQNTNFVPRATDEEIIQEWVKLNNAFSRPPSMREIEQLRKEGTTRFYPAVYVNRFGKVDNRTTFPLARERLNVITMPTLINEALAEYESRAGIQVRYNSKMHRSAEEEAKRRLAEIIKQSQKLSTVNPILYDRFGRPLLVKP